MPILYTHQFRKKVSLQVVVVTFSMTSFQFYYQNISCYFLNLCYEARRNSITMKMYPELLFKLCSHQSTYFLNQPKIRNIQQVWKTIRMTANLIISMAAPVLVGRNNTNNCWYSSHQSVTYSWSYMNKDNFRMNVPFNVLFWCYFSHFSLPMKWEVVQ